MPEAFGAGGFGFPAVDGLAGQAGDAGDVADAVRVGAGAHGGTERCQGVEGVLYGGGEPKLTPAEAYRRALRAWIADPSPANAAARQEAAERYKAALCRQGQKAYC